MKRTVAVLIGYVSFFATISTSLYFLVLRLTRETIALAIALPSFLEKISLENEQFISFYKKLTPETKSYIHDTVTSLAKNLNELLSTLAGSAFTIVSDFPGYFIAFLVFVIATFLLGIEYPALKPAFLRFFAEGKSRDSINMVLSKLQMATIGFLRAQIILSSLTFVITAIALKIIGIEYVLFSSFVVVLIDLMPILGTGAALVPWAMYYFFIGGINEGIGLLILFLIMTIIRRTLEPKILADSLDMSPLVTLIAMYIGLSTFGIIGMILVPAMVLIYKTLEEADIYKIKFKFK
jgi:sporulation integral membrane protein YtvI